MRHDGKRVSLSSIMPIETLTPALRIRPTFDQVAASISKLAGKSFAAIEKATQRTRSTRAQFKAGRSY